MASQTVIKTDNENEASTSVIENDLSLSGYLQIKIPRSAEKYLDKIYSDKRN